jgi:hypothetical protein
MLARWVQRGCLKEHTPFVSVFWNIPSVSASRLVECPVRVQEQFLRCSLLGCLLDSQLLTCAAIVSDIFGVTVCLHFREQCREIRGQALRLWAARTKGAPRIEDILDGLVGVYLSLSRHQNFSCGPIYHRTRAGLLSVGWPTVYSSIGTLLYIVGLNTDVSVRAQWQQGRSRNEARRTGFYPVLLATRFSITVRFRQGLRLYPSICCGGRASLNLRMEARA